MFFLNTYLSLLTIGLALAAASAQLQDSNIPPAGRVAGYTLPLRAVSSTRHSPLHTAHRLRGWEVGTHR